MAQAQGLLGRRKRKWMFLREAAPRHPDEEMTHQRQRLRPHRPGEGAQGHADRLGKSLPDSTCSHRTQSCDLAQPGTHSAGKAAGRPQADSWRIPAGHSSRTDETRWGRGCPCEPPWCIWKAQKMEPGAVCETERCVSRRWPVGAHIWTDTPWVGASSSALHPSPGMGAPKDPLPAPPDHLGQKELRASRRNPGDWATDGWGACMGSRPRQRWSEPRATAGKPLCLVF